MEMKFGADSILPRGRRPYSAGNRGHRQRRQFPAGRRRRRGRGNPPRGRPGHHGGMPEDRGVPHRTGRNHQRRKPESPIRDPYRGPDLPGWNPRRRKIAGRRLPGKPETGSEKGIRSLAFPSLSTGAYGYPLDEAAAIALTTVVGFIKENPVFDRVGFVLFGSRISMVPMKGL